MRLKGHRKRVYALYHGDDYIYDGTLAELAKHLNLSQKTLQFYTTPAYRRRIKTDGNHWVLTMIGWNDDNED